MASLHGDIGEHFHLSFIYSIELIYHHGIGCAVHDALCTREAQEYSWVVRIVRMRPRWLKCGSQANLYLNVPRNPDPELVLIKKNLVRSWELWARRSAISHPDRQEGGKKEGSRL